MAQRRLLDELHLAETPLLREQLKLMLANAKGGTVPALLLVALMAYIVRKPADPALLKVWMAMTATSILLSYFVSRPYSNNDVPAGQGIRLVRKLIVTYMLEGATWGCLPWLVMGGQDSPAEHAVVMVFIAGMIATVMAQTSVLLPVFISFSIPPLLLLFARLLTLGDITYSLFSGVAFIYLVMMIMAARESAATTLSAIHLRIENTELLERLHIEKEAAERANIAKSKFLAAASHDLRQPIHAQGLFLNVLARSKLDPRQQELIECIRNAVESSGDMLGTLLDFSRIEAGIIKPVIISFPLQQMFAKLGTELSPLSDAKGIFYRYRDTKIQVASDPALVELILRNLISNAIRYTEKGGILVGARRRGDRVLVEVWDTGIGIETSQQQTIFQEFYQLDNPERDNRKGFGLGLSIADGLARTLKHDIELSSVAGRGSVFRLCLPLAGTAETTPLETAVSIPSMNRLHGLRMLVIDDDVNIRKGMQQLLNSWGCDCRAAEAIEEALALVAGFHPDCVISDYRLREQRTGAEAIAALRHALDETLPALLITGDTDPKRLREAEASGIPLLHKPASSEQLYRNLVDIVKTD